MMVGKENVFREHYRCSELKSPRNDIVMQMKEECSHELGFA